MKSILAISLLMSSVAAFAWPEHVFEGVPEEFCKNKIMKGSFAFCSASNAKAVMSAKKGGDVVNADYASLGFHTYNAIDLGVIVDADSNDAYFYTKWLVDANGKKVGVLTINGYYNTEMEVAGRVDVRYNLKGEIVSLEDKEIN